MTKKRHATPTKWTVSAESFDLGRGRYGFIDDVRTTAPGWDWFAEGGELGPIDLPLHVAASWAETERLLHALARLLASVGGALTYRDAREARMARTR